MNNIPQLLEDYQLVLHFRNNRIDTKTFLARVESFFGGKVSCNSCPSAIKKATSDFERVILTSIYKIDKSILVQPNKELLKNTRFVNGMYETIMTSSFDSFPELLESFVKDYKNGRKIMSETDFKAAYEELIAFNRKRLNYFDTEEYKAYLISMMPKVEEEEQEEELMQESFASLSQKSSDEVVVVKPKRNKKQTNSTNNNGSTEETTNQS